MRQKVILTAAVNGASLRKAQNSAVPEQPAEIGRDAEACWNAGAAVVHYHIRDQEGAPCCSPRILSEINDQVAARCPIITQASTAPLRAVEESLELFQAPHLPEMMTMAMTGLNWGSMNSAARPAMAMAQSTAMITSSRALGLRPSKIRKKGSIHSSKMSREIK